MTEPMEPLTPVQIERKLRQLVNEMTKAQSALRETRDVEVVAKHAYERAYRAAMLSSDRPKVERGGYTTAERDAWVEEQAADLKEKYEIAEVIRKAAEDHLRVIRDQAMVVMSLGKSVNTAYNLAGDGR